MNNEEYNQWLDSLKVGDSVAIKEHHFGTTQYVISKIIHITPKRWIKTAKNNDVYKEGAWRATGRYNFSHSKLVPITPEITERIEYIQIKGQLINLDYDKLSRDQIKAIYEIVNPKQ